MANHGISFVMIVLMCSERMALLCVISHISAQRRSEQEGEKRDKEKEREREIPSYRITSKGIKGKDGQGTN